jgi:hypothetical protein
MFVGKKGETKKWKLGALTLPTENSAKILGGIISDDLSVTKHFEMRRKAGWKVFNALKSVGMIGGSLPITDSMFLMAMSVWPAIDYGRCVLPDFGKANKKERTAKDKQLMKMCRIILGTNNSAAAAGVLGETTCMMDFFRGQYKCLTFVNRLKDPDLTNKWVRSICGDERHKELPIFKLAAEWLPALGITQKPGCSKQTWKNTIAPKIQTEAEEAWLREVALTESLWLYASFKKKLRPPFYTTMRNFRGRTALVRARLCSLFLPEFFEGNKCKRCREELNPEFNIIAGGKVFLHQHLLLGCKDIQPILQEFLYQADWLPANWNNLRWEHQMGHLLLLHDDENEVRDERAIRLTGNYLASLCEDKWQKIEHPERTH